MTAPYQMMLARVILYLPLVFTGWVCGMIAVGAAVVSPVYVAVAAVRLWQVWIPLTILGALYAFAVHRAASGARWARYLVLLIVTSEGLLYVFDEKTWSREYLSRTAVVICYVASQAVAVGILFLKRPTIRESGHAQL